MPRFSPPDLPLPKSWPKRVKRAFLHVVAFAQMSVIETRSWAVNSRSERVRLKAKVVALEQEVSLLTEEMRIKDARMAKIPARRRPHYPPCERLAILALRTARGWSLVETARHFLIEARAPATWNRRVDEEGEGALVRMPEPVNRFPDFVGQMVRSLRAVCPSMGKQKLAEHLARAGLHLGPSTVGRTLKGPRAPIEPLEAQEPNASNAVTARGVHDVWQTDLTVVPTGGGFSVPWCPFSLPQRWPFCWWVALVIDHYSRHVVGYAVFKKTPTGAEVRSMLGRAISVHGTAPRYLVSDKGPQFSVNNHQKVIQ